MRHPIHDWVRPEPPEWERHLGWSELHELKTLLGKARNVAAVEPRTPKAWAAWRSRADSVVARIAALEATARIAEMRKAGMA